MTHWIRLILTVVLLATVCATATAAVVDGVELTSSSSPPNNVTWLDFDDSDVHKMPVPNSDDDDDDDYYGDQDYEDEPVVAPLNISSAQAFLINRLKGAKNIQNPYNMTMSQSNVNMSRECVLFCE